MLEPNATPWETADQRVSKPRRGAMSSERVDGAPLGLEYYYGHGSQGVALGFNISAPLVLRKKCNFKTGASGSGSS